MSKKSTKPNKEEASFKVVNLTKNAFPLKIQRDGKNSFIDIRRQGRGGQIPPVLKHSELTDYVNKLVKRGFIKLERV